MKLSTALFISLAAALVLTVVRPSVPADAGRIRPPAPPKHERRELTTGAELAADLAEVVTYLEAGQAYFRAYQRGSHTVEENAEFLGFLENYEREHKVAKKEVAALKIWVKQKGSLDSAVSDPKP